MRITGGILRGRYLKVPDGPVRPTQDRVREALFSILAEYLPGARFLDLYAGSGAVGIEAWSRGAEAICCVEENRRVHRILKENVSQFCPERAEAVCCSAVAFLEKRVAPGAFHIIFADPPYGRRGRDLHDEGRDRKEIRRREGVQAHDSLDGLLDALTVSRALAEDGVFVMEQALESDVSCPAGWALTKDRCYGKSRLLFFQRVAGAQGAAEERPEKA